MPPTATSAPPQPPASLSSLEAEMFQAHNAERSAQGLAPLQLDSTLVAIARERSEDMADNNYFAHTSPSGETAFSLMDAAGYAYTTAGENIARNNYPSSQSVDVAMDGFMNSSGHRSNILQTQFTRVGIGVGVDSSGMIYYTVVFAG